MSEIAQNSIPVGLHLIINSLTDSYEKSMVNRWYKEYQTHQQKRTRRLQVLEAVEEGYDTLSEISAHTGIPQPTVRRIVEQFVAQKRINSMKAKNTNNRIEIRYELAS
ncbi:MAG TPA: helix-turn-helix domain-containing protein [Pyrinomonadaceae bacterium]|jgi:Fic family protein